MRWTNNDSQPTTASATVVFTKPLGKLGSEKDAWDGKRGRIRIRDSRKKRREEREIKEVGPGRNG